VPGQVRILEALAGIGYGVMTRALISEVAHVSVGWMSDYLGRVRPGKREEAEARSGLVGLLTLGYVEEIVLDIDGLKERNYRITAAGRRVLARARR
jgi:hypothetical protein